MPADDQYVRSQLLRTLMDRVAEEPYPSSTMLDMIESLLHPDEVPAYAEMLLERVRSEQYPSIPVIRRLQALV